MIVRTAALAIALAVTSLSAAGAASLSVAPLGVALDKASSSTTLTVTNAGDDAVELSAAAYRWTQSADQSQILTPTPDIVVYPHQFTLTQLQQHVLRIGLVAKPDAVETDYRIVITELPKTETGMPTALQMRTRLSIPLFVQAGKGSRSAVLGAASANATELKFTIGSTGTSHLLVRDAALELRDAKNAVISTQHVTGWYVLPGNEQSYTADLPKDACAKIAHIVIHVTQETGPVVDLNGTPDRACAAR